MTGEMEELKTQIDDLAKERDIYAKALAESNAAFREKVNEFSIIRRIGDAMRWNFDKKQVCQSIVDVIIEETSAENCSLWLVDTARSCIKLAAARGQRDMKARFFPPEDPNTNQIALGEGVSGWVAKNGKPMLIKDVAESNQFIEMGAKAPSIKSLLCIPITGGDETVGVINLSHPDIGMFSKENERVLALITNHAAIAFANLFLFEKIQSFNEELERTVEERTRSLSFSESKYRTFMENAGDAILVVDKAGGKIIEVNSRACEYTGMSREEMTGRDINSILGGGHRNMYDNIVTAGFGRMEGVPMITSGGYEVFSDITVNVMSTQGGEFVHLVIRDITHKLKLEAKLKEYNESLEEMVRRRTEELEKAQQELLHASKMAAIGELASGVAHEINNPLAVISGYAEDLRDRIKSKGLEIVGHDGIMSVMAMITTQAERCLEITRSLLNFSRRQELYLSAVDLNYAIRVTQGMAMHRASDKRIEMDNFMDPHLPQVVTDLNMLEQILLNIFNNAVDAIDGDGKIFTRVTARDGSVLIEVEDTGQGIKNDNLPKIFDPFFTTKPVGKGTGLGLSISHHLAESLKGKITVESEPGRGARFTLTIPVGIENKPTQ
ncbi:MAG: GAF domain-containing protein [Nitrospinae bacterium]|nr:GAF domain-containing protein [Nitrospinota bacterium]